MINKATIFCFLIGISFSLKSQTISEIDELSLPFTWDVRWDSRLDYLIQSPNDSILISKLSKVSDNFWQKELYDLEGNWLDSYRYFKDESGLVKVNKGESFLDDRYYFSDKLTKRVLAQDGRPIAEWILKYEDNRINRFSLRDTTKFEERVYLYDDNNLPLKTIIYVNGDYHAEELYEYDNEKKLKTLYRLGTLKDTVAKTSFERRSEQLIKKLDYKKNEAAALVLVESTDYNYRSLSNKRESSNTLYYSSKGICVMSRTKKFDNEGSLVSAEDINLINGDWSMVRSFYFTIDDGAIVMGE
ncbi:MAG: hypothetical protein ACJAZH_000835 [Roseivirga sp.]|jgi:hypothetical protein